MKSSILRLLWTTLMVCQIAGLAHAATVKLAWDPNTEADLAGYNVYRSQTSGSGYSRLNGSLVLTSSFNDATVVSGQTYFYSVTAVNTLAVESGFSNEVTVVVGFPDLAITKSHSGSFPVGANGLYTVTVSNVGSAASSGMITVTDTLPVGLSFVSGAGGGWSFAASGQTITCLNSGPIAGGASSILTLTVAVGAAAFPAVTNAASVSNSSDANPANNNASDPTTIVPAGSNFYTLTPCRVLDTRNPNGPFGGPALVANSTRIFTMAGRCGIPSTARAVSVNITVTQPTDAGYLRLYPGGTPPPLASSINYRVGKTRANSSIVSLGLLGDIAVGCVQASGTAQFIIDVNGYFQ